MSILPCMSHSIVLSCSAWKCCTGNWSDKLHEHCVEAINVFSVGVAVILKFRIDGLKVNCFKYSAFSDINCVQYLEETEQRVPSWTCSQAVSKPVWHTPLLCVQWRTPDDGQRNCPKHVEFYSKNNFEKLVHLVGFVIRISHDARSPECQTMH